MQNYIIVYIHKIYKVNIINDVYKLHNIKYLILNKNSTVYLMARTEEGRRCIADFRLRAYFLKNMNIIHTKYEYNVRTHLRLYTISMQSMRLVEIEISELQKTLISHKISDT